MIPACEPVNERDFAPSELMASESRAIEMRSPEVSSMSSSRGLGLSVTWWARSSSSSVVSPIAETTTTTWFPAFWAAITRFATCLILLASPTDDPPYFCTIRAKALLLKIVELLDFEVGFDGESVIFEIRRLV
jgi:hypothetical protein